VEDMRAPIRRPVLTPAAVGTVAGVLGWAVGSLAFPAGLGTLVLAAGLLAAAALYRAARWRASPRPVPAWARARLLRLAMLGAVLVVATSVGLGAAGYAELTVPVGCTVVGACLLPAAGLLDRRGCLPLGAALMLLGAAGALLALRSVGEMYPMGLVGLGAGALLWAAVAIEAGLHRELRTKIGSR
jgi:uncharacterized membrane protein